MRSCALTDCNKPRLLFSPSTKELICGQWPGRHWLKISEGQGLVASGGWGGGLRNKQKREKNYKKRETKMKGKKKDREEISLS